MPYSDPHLAHTYEGMGNIVINTAETEKSFFYFVHSMFMSTCSCGTDYICEVVGSNKAKPPDAVSLI